LPSCDGVLVGSASLKVDDFIEMVKIADNIWGCRGKQLLEIIVYSNYGDRKKISNLYRN
jgi:hypothetical protein